MKRRTHSAQFFAGFFDADGSIAIGQHGARGTWLLKVVVTQVRPEILLLFQDRYGGHLSNWGRAGEGNRAPVRAWLASCGTAETFLRDVTPYLVVKYDRAVLALEFRELFKGANRLPTRPSKRPEAQARLALVIDRRQACVDRMRGLNQKGVALCIPS